MRRLAKLRTVPARLDGSEEKLLFLRYCSVWRGQVLQFVFEFAPANHANKRE